MMCSDGVYDKLTNEEVAQCFWENKELTNEEREKYQFIGSVPSKVIERSMEKMSMDNLTSLVIVFEDHGRFMLPTKKNQKVGDK
jgi:serine/threonine protein phosphatase PrpC